MACVDWSSFHLSLTGYQKVAKIHYTQYQLPTNCTRTHMILIHKIIANAKYLVMFQRYIFNLYLSLNIRLLHVHKDYHRYSEHNAVDKALHQSPTLQLIRRE